jgi:acyl-CoA thioesterase-1
VKDDPALPRVLLIGASISVYYTLRVRELLKGKANVHRIMGGAGDTVKGLRMLNEWLGDSHGDVLHFNFGLWDVKRGPDDKLPVSIALPRGGQ